MANEYFEGPDIHVAYPNGKIKKVDSRAVVFYDEDVVGGHYDIKWSDVFDPSDPVAELALSGDILNDLKPKEDVYIRLAEATANWDRSYGRAKAIDAWDLVSDELELQINRLSRKTKHSLASTSRAIAGDITISLEVLERLAKDQGL